jgi:hypothetical protein
MAEQQYRVSASNNQSDCIAIVASNDSETQQQQQYLNYTAHRSDEQSERTLTN